MFSCSFFFLQSVSGYKNRLLMTCVLCSLGDRRMAVHNRKLTVDRRMPTLPDGAVRSSSGKLYKLYLKLFFFSYITGCPCLFPQFLIQVGPHAVNLAGGQAASMRIARDIIGRHQQKGGQALELSGQKPKTEEYIQQMRGLFWL